jgi:hypothetical protein
MALALGAKLTNQTVAKFGQLMIEYDPHPPFGRLDWSIFDEMQTALAPLMSQHLTTQEPAHMIAFVLYPGLTVFDLAGPLEVLSALSRIAPQFRPVVVAEQAGPVMTDIGVQMVPNATFADLPHPHAFFVPGGGVPTLNAMSNLAIRLYVNGFQPSMKLQAISTDGRKPRRVYDAAKTPLQRLLLCQVLPASSEQELQRAARMLDPLRLLHHLQGLQQALLCPQIPPASEAFEKAPGAILPFCLERCVGRPYALSLALPEPVAVHRIPSSCREDDSACATLSA